MAAVKALTTGSKWQWNPAANLKEKQIRKNKTEKPVMSTPRAPTVGEAEQPRQGTKRPKEQRRPNRANMYATARRQYIPHGTQVPWPPRLEALLLPGRHPLWPMGPQVLLLLPPPPHTREPRPPRSKSQRAQTCRGESETAPMEDRNVRIHHQHTRGRHTRDQAIARRT